MATRARLAATGLLLGSAYAAETDPSVVRVRAWVQPTSPELHAYYRYHEVIGPGLGTLRLQTGAGVIALDPPRVITNLHIIAGARRVEIVAEHDSWEVDPSQIHTDPRADLALLWVPESIAAPAQHLATTPLEIDAPLTTLGFPLGGPLASHPGTFAGWTERALPQAPIRILGLSTASIREGVSGGPVIDGAGDLVGVAVAGSKQTSDLHGQSLFVPISRIREMSSETCPDGSWRAAVALDKGGVRVRASSGPLSLGDHVQGVDDQPVGDLWDLSASCHPTATWAIERDGDALVPTMERTEMAFSDLLRVNARGEITHVSQAAWMLGLDLGDTLTHPTDGSWQEGVVRGPIVVRVAGEGYAVIP